MREVREFIIPRTFLILLLLFWCQSGRVGLVTLSLIAMLGKKKGNVDSDIIFSAMKRLYLKDDFDKIVLVSGDGDYKMLVDFLIEQDKFEKILFPNHKYSSSLYKSLSSRFFAYLDDVDVQRKIEKEKGSLGS